MALLFNRLKNWVRNENFKSADVNAEFNNILNNSSLTTLSGYSSNVSQMQTQTNPGAQGSESLSQTAADEISRLRYVINRILGATYWYDTPTLSMASIVNLVNQGNLTPPPNRIESGRTRSTSNQPLFLVADGSAATVSLVGVVVPFVYRVANIQYTISSTVTKTGLSLAAGSATALVNDTSLGGAAATKVQGEGTSTIIIDTQTANFTAGATINTFQAFKVNGEYFIGYMKDANTIAKCFRGFFFDNTGAPVARAAISNNDTITLMKLTWVFANTNGTLSVVYTNPTYSFDTPTSPNTGDYWFDLNSKIWKVYNGSSFADATALLIGICIQDSTNCVASRSFEFYGAYDAKNTIVLETQDNNTLRSIQPGGKMNVAGNLISFDKNLVRWVMSTDLDTGLAEGSSTTYYAYVKDTGDVVLSDVTPYDRTHDLGGKYHPYNPWRSCGSVLNDGSSNFSTVTSDSEWDNVTQKTTSVVGADNIGSLMSSTGANAIVNTRTRATGTTVAKGGVAISASSGAFSTTNTAATDVTNLTVTIATTGKPVEIKCIQDGNAAGGNFSAAAGAVSVCSATWWIQRDGSTIARSSIQINAANGGGTLAIYSSPTLINTVDPVAAGTYVYKVQIAADAGTTTAALANTKLVAFEPA